MTIHTLCITVEVPTHMEGLIDEGNWYRYHKPILQDKFYGDGAWLTSMYQPRKTLTMHVVVRMQDFEEALNNLHKLGVVTQDVKVHINSFK